MKANLCLQRIHGAGSLLALAFSITASQVIAGPIPQFSQQIEKNRAEIAAKSPAAKPVDVSIMKCRACKTVTLSEAVYTKRESAEIDDYGYIWIDVGAKHTCAQCGGTLTILKGASAGAMTQPCAMCGKDAAQCLATVRAVAPRT